MMKFKASEISDAINSIPVPLRDTLMKYVYKGFEYPKDYSSSALLTWHEKVSLYFLKRKLYLIIDFLIEGSCSYWSRFDCTCTYRSTNCVNCFNQ